MRYNLIVAAMALFLVACASVGTEIDMAKTADIVKGVTTREDLISWFGSPTSVGIDANGNVTATWIYSEARNHGTNFIPVYGALNMKMDTRLQQLIVIFDDNDENSHEFV